MCAAPLSMFLRSRRFLVVAVRLLGAAITLIPPYFFVPETMRLGPLRVRAFVFVRCPRTGRPLR
jgi:hypothetical protein